MVCLGYRLLELGRGKPGFPAEDLREVVCTGKAGGLCGESNGHPGFTEEQLGIFDAGMGDIFAGGDADLTRKGSDEVRF